MGVVPHMKLTLVDSTGVMKCFVRPTGPVRQIDGIWQELAQRSARGRQTPRVGRRNLWGPQTTPEGDGHMPKLTGGCPQQGISLQGDPFFCKLFFLPKLGEINKFGCGLCLLATAYLTLMIQNMK